MQTKFDLIVVGGGFAGTAAAIAAAALFFLPSVFYDRRAKREESLTYTILRLF